MKLLNIVNTSAHTLRRGFTMIELLVVIAIIGMLATIGIWGGMRLFKSSDEAKSAATADVVKAAAERYRTDNMDYPDKEGGESVDKCVVYGNVSSNNRLSSSNVTFLMELFGRNTSGQRDDSMIAYVEDTSMLYYYSGSGKTIQKLDEAKSISTSGVIGFPVTMRKTKSSKYKDLSGAKAFAPIRITIDYSMGEYLTVEVPKDNDFEQVIKL